MTDTTEMPGTKAGTMAICKACGNKIEYVNPYWRHIGDWQPRHIAMPEDTIPDVAELQRQNAVLKEFARAVIEPSFDGGEMDGGQVQELAKKLRILISEKVTREMMNEWSENNSYPDGDADFDIGDTIYNFADWMTDDTAAMPQPSKAEVAREFMDEVSLRVDDTGMRFEGAADEVLKEWEDAESK